MSSRRAVYDYDSALEFLYGRINYERTTQIPYSGGEFKLDRMRRLMHLLGDPQTKLPTIHVAGTKGKGSTASMIASALTAAGLKTGLYTSPHLERLNERFCIDGMECTDEELTSLTREVEEVVLAMERDVPNEINCGSTFFELTTALCFLQFARQNVAAAVIEVGLGGRLDSTNVCLPSVCVITSISFDHTKQLGNTLAAIAGEKAGIIKPGVPVVSGVMTEEPRRVIENIALEQNAPLLQRGRDFDIAPEMDASHTYRYWERDNAERTELANLRIGMIGRHQAANAATAAATLGCLRRQGWRIPESDVRVGFEKASCPARVEVVSQHPTVVLDAAHNVASIQALVDALREEFSSASRRILIFAASRDKDAVGMLRLLLPAFEEIVLTRFVKNPRARSPEELAEIADSLLNELGSTVELRCEDDPVAAWQSVRRDAAVDDLICITGSFFLAAELRPLPSV